MQWAAGTKHSVTNDNRVTHSHPCSYTIYKRDGVFYAESNLPSGTDYDDADYATVFNAAEANLPSGGTIYTHQADITLASGIQLGNYVTALFAPLCDITVTTTDDPAIDLSGIKPQLIGQGFLNFNHSQGTSCIRFDDTIEGLVKNVWVNGGNTASSIGVEYQADTANIYNTLNRCRFFNLSRGLKTTLAAGYINRINALFTRFDANTVGTAYGAYVDTGTGHVFLGCEFGQNDNGFYYDGTMCHLLGCVIDSNTVNGIELGGSHQGLYFQGAMWTTATAISGALHATDRFEFTGDKFGSDSGTATILDNTTSIAVSHNLGYTPDLQDISATPVEDLNTANCFWVADPTATDFDIHVDADPDTDVDFVWQIKRVGA